MQLPVGEHEKIPKKLVCQLPQLLRLRVADCEVLLQLRLGLVLVGLHQVQIAQQRGHRRPNIVGDGAQQICIGLPGLLLFFELIQECTAHLVDIHSQIRKFIPTGFRNLQLQIPRCNLVDAVGNVRNTLAQTAVIEQDYR